MLPQQDRHALTFGKRTPDKHNRVNIPHQLKYFPNSNPPTLPRIGAGRAQFRAHCLRHGAASAILNSCVTSSGILRAGGLSPAGFKRIRDPQEAEESATHASLTGVLSEPGDCVFSEGAPRRAPTPLRRRYRFVKLAERPTMSPKQ